MIKIKVSDLLGKHKMNRKQLAEAAHIRPNTVGALYDESIRCQELNQSFDLLLQIRITIPF